MSYAFLPGALNDEDRNTYLHYYNLLLAHTDERELVCFARPGTSEAGETNLPTAKGITIGLFHTQASSSSTESTNL